MSLSPRALFAASAGIASTGALSGAQAAPAAHPAGVQTPLEFGGDPGCVTVFGQSGGGLKTTRGAPAPRWTLRRPPSRFCDGAALFAA